MRKFWMVVLFLVVSVTGYAQKRYFVNASAGLDYNIKKFHNDDKREYTKLENGQTDYNMGIDIGYRLWKRLNVRLELRYVEYNWGKKWNEPVLAEGTTDRYIVESELTLSNFAINPRLDFKFMDARKWEMYVSVGYRMEYATNHNQISVDQDGNILSRHNYVNTDYRENMAGLLSGLIVKYKINNHLGVFLAPDYTLFNNSLYPKNLKVMQRFNTNLGVSWNF